MISFRFVRISCKYILKNLRILNIIKRFLCSLSYILPYILCFINHLINLIKYSTI